MIANCNLSQRVLPAVNSASNSQHHSSSCCDAFPYWFGSNATIRRCIAPPCVVVGSTTDPPKMPPTHKWSTASHQWTTDAHRSTTASTAAATQAIHSHQDVRNTIGDQRQRHGKWHEQGERVIIDMYIVELTFTLRYIKCCQVFLDLDFLVYTF